mmetsp:Transcript_46637/g.123164  ORF Transcript_46637/g.123164 Transcript_46637/m.123164 type:complete len:224 (-) Transcript_46637:543-1214(-)
MGRGTRINGARTGHVATAASRRTTATARSSSGRPRTVARALGRGFRPRAPSSSTRPRRAIGRSLPTRLAGSSSRSTTWSLQRARTAKERARIPRRFQRSLGRPNGSSGLGARESGRRKRGPKRPRPRSAARAARASTSRTMRTKAKSAAGTPTRESSCRRGGARRPPRRPAAPRARPSSRSSRQARRSLCRWARRSSCRWTRGGPGAGHLRRRRCWAPCHPLL